MSYDVCVIGAGPGGYVCALRAAQKGLKTVLIERESLGGVCLNVGCIPSKAMITASDLLSRIQNDSHHMGVNVSQVNVDMKKMVSWKDSVCKKMSQGVSALLKARGVDVIFGEASFKDLNTLEIKGKKKSQLSASYFVIATGSQPISIPGFDLNKNEILSSTEVLDLKELPKKVLVIGGGYIGLEIGSYLAQLGSQVHIVEHQSSLLYNMADSDCSQVVYKGLIKKGVKVSLETKACSYKKVKSAYEVSLESHGKKEKVTVDKVLLTVGRKPNTDQVGLENIDLEKDAHGFLEVNSQRRTSQSHIFAIGDVVKGPALAHKASYEGVLVAEVIAGDNRAYDVKTVPSVIFTHPEIASVGLTQKECEQKGIKVKVGKFPFSANGRAVSLMATEGFVKIIADFNTHVVLGVHIVGVEASQLISEAALAVEMGATLEDVALTIHPHPSLSETLMEAAECALGHPIHTIQK